MAPPHAELGVVPSSPARPFPPHQVAAMQTGLLKVVPQAVLDLLTWQELEKKVCGDPEVTVDALRKLSECGGAGQGRAAQGWSLNSVSVGTQE